MLRQFRSEGFVNQYVLQSRSADGKTLTFVTEGVENAPPGLRARRILRILNNDEFIESFEIAAPGEEFAPILENRLRRAP